MIRIKSDANTCPDFKYVLIPWNRLIDDLAQLRRHAQYPLLALNFRCQNDKLIPTKASHRVRGSHSIAQSLTENLENLIASKMSVLIIAWLKAIQVKKEQRQLPTLTLCLTQ